MKLPLTLKDRDGKLVVRGLTEIEDADGILLAEVVTINAEFEHFLKSLSSEKF